MTRCLTCGCTDDCACVTAAGACWWVVADVEFGIGICSACATPEQLVAKLLWLAAKREEDGATIHELVTRTGVSNARIARALRALEGKGLVERGSRLTNGVDVWHLVVPS